MARLESTADAAAKGCRAGDWVEVERVLLEAGERAANLPADTASKPLVMWINGFAKAEAEVGDEVLIETVTGRRVTGRLSCAKPGYYHTFGDYIPELAHVGPDLRARVAAYRTAGPR